MEIFFSNDIRADVLRLDAEEALHCVRVLRHRSGDTVNVIDGRGNLYHCTLLSDEAAGGKRAGGEGVEARIESVEANWHSHPYHLTLAVCPTKNPDRYEWMAEKATEVGLDRLVPVIGDRSERKFVGKTARLERVLLSAAKQSLKARLPELAEAVSVRDFVAGSGEVGSNVAGCVVAGGELAGGELAGGELAGDGLAGCGLAGDGLAGRQLPSPPLPPRTELTQKTSGDGSAEAADASSDGSSCPGTTPELRMIAYCSDEVQPRASIMEELREFWKKVRWNGGVAGNQSDEPCDGWAARGQDGGQGSEAAGITGSGAAGGHWNGGMLESGAVPEIVVLIGPEGDFSPEEVREAIAAGFVPVSLGESRLRTETAAVTAAEAVYLSLL